MNRLQKQTFIQRIAIENRSDPIGTRVIWSRHAISELVNDDLSRRVVEAALEGCEIIEDYPQGHRPLPDCLVLAMATKGQPLHAVVALDIVQDRILIVTVYLPSVERWENDWRTRK